MTSLEDRRTRVHHIDIAHAAGARLRPACEVAGNLRDRRLVVSVANPNKPLHAEQ